jgi:hypothetical protein
MFFMFCSVSEFYGLTLNPISTGKVQMFNTGGKLYDVLVDHGFPA